MKSHSFFSFALKVLSSSVFVNLLHLQTLCAAENIGNRASIPIKGQYIVVFKDRVTNARSEVSNLNRNGMMRVKYIYDFSLKGFSAEIPDIVLNALKNNPRVQYIEQDQTVSIDQVATQSSVPSWGLDRVNQRILPLDSLYTYSNTGSGIVAYVIDTGIQTSHNDFGGRATVGIDIVGDGKNGIDCNGHGTHVAGSIGGTTYGIAKQVNLVAVRVLDCSGSGSISGVIAGIDWVVSDNSNTSSSSNAGKLAVANMSLGGGASSSLDNAVNNAVSKNIVFAVAAGNSNANACNYSPARAASAIAVGATTNSDFRASYSNYGSCLDIFAPGSSITSDWINNSTKTISGTSMATPHVTGTSALLRQFYPSHTASGIWSDMLGQSTSNVVSSAGRKSPNRLLYSSP